MLPEPIKGKRYRVKTGTRTIEGRYLGKDYTGRWQFDLRPEFGTTPVHPADALSIEEVKK